jgi:hypothetical protein
LTTRWEPATTLRETRATGLLDWLDTIASRLDADDPAIGAAVGAVREAARRDAHTDEAFEAIEGKNTQYEKITNYLN